MLHLHQALPVLILVLVFHPYLALASLSDKTCESCNLSCKSIFCKQECSGFPCNMTCDSARICSQNCSKGHCDVMACKANMCNSNCEVGYCSKMTCDATMECRLTCDSHCQMTCSSYSCIILCFSGYCQISIVGGYEASIFCFGGHCNIRCPSHRRCNIMSCPSNSCNITYEKELAPSGKSNYNLSAFDSTPSSLVLIALFISLFFLGA